MAAISGWTIPPIRWGGSTISNYNANESDGKRNFSQSQAVNLRASSYIYQPWYAQVSGDIGLLTGSFSGGESTSDNTALTYGGNLNLFPQSRFPFNAYVQSSDSRVDANTTGANYTATRLGMRQTYRPEVGAENYSASFDRSVIATNSARSIVNAMQSSFSTARDSQTFNANARYSNTSGDAGGQGSDLFSLAGSHSWRDEDRGLSVASSANYTNNQIQMLNGASLSRNNSQIMQAGSSVTWLPDEDLPLTIVGGGNLVRMDTQTETASLTLTNLNGYANTNYQFSNNLRGSGGLTLNQIQSNDRQLLSTGQNASLSYSGNALTFGDYSYNWGAGAGIANQTIQNGRSSFSTTGQAQHFIQRSISLGRFGPLFLNASQGYGLTTNSLSGQSGTLTHIAGISWSQGLGERIQGMLSATISDSMTTGDFSSHFRNLSTNGNLQWQLSSRSVLSANLNFNLSQQLESPSATLTGTNITIPASDGRRNLNGSGQLSYSHRNPFNFPNLFYTASFQVNANQSNLRLTAGDPNALNWQTSNVFQQQLHYSIGRLYFRATNSFAKLNGKENASVFFLVGRDIGDL